MNTPVSGGAVSDALALADELERDKWHVTAVTMQRAADCLRSLALTQPAVPVLSKEPDGEVYSANCDYATVQWFKPNDKAGGDPKNSWSWPIKGTKVYLAAPQPAPTPREPTHDQVEAAYSVWCHSTHKDPFVRMSMALRAALAAPLASEPEPVVAEQARDWKPIATAPRDGRSILIAFGQDGVSQAKYIPGLPHPWQFIDTSDGITWMVNHAIDGLGGPSHWQELPIWAPVTLTGQAVSREIGSAPKEVQILIAERDNLASAFARMATLAVQALEYHQEQTRPIDRTTKTINQLRATLASQSTPPPESAGLSVVRRKPRAYLHYAVKKPSMQRLAWTADLLTQEKASGWATIELVEQANRTAQPDGGSGK